MVSKIQIINLFISTNNSNYKSIYQHQKFKKIILFMASKIQKNKIILASKNQITNPFISIKNPNYKSIYQHQKFKKIILFMTSKIQIINPFISIKNSKK